ncbi:MAG: dethiobiotin synthase [Zoogloeaceae bacterium]|nr:dethiobiotin synthase [Zoogloeaceae bacterium]MCK6385623.1 dethiobiotin synthase [Rhodocyclaceae bacterium]
MSQAYFLTGTDTGVGKTLIAAALLRAAAAQGLRALGMKPVAAGGDEDVDALVAAGNVAAPRELINPYLLREPLSPHLAARRDGTAIDLEHVARCFNELRRRADFLVVEGAGGFRVPLSDTHDGADLAARLGLPVILVIGLRLGCLNHALLTAEAIRARGLPLAGWVANQVDPAMACVAENVDTLRARLPAPLLGVVPFQDHPNPAQVATLLELPE